MNGVRAFRHSELLFLVGNGLLNPYCIDFYIMYVLGVALYFNAAVYERARRHPISVEYLPHLETLSLTKIGLFGNTYNELWDIKDLQKHEIT